MSTKSKKQENVITWILASTAIVSAIAALISAFYAGNANRKAEEANRVAAQANEINSLSVNPNIILNPQNITAIPQLRGCKEGDQYQLWAEINYYSTFSNSGGAATQIIDFSLTNSEEIKGTWLYPKNLWERKADTTKIPKPLPVDLPAESSVVLGFTAIKPLVFSNSLDEIQANVASGSYIPEDKLIWVFVFGNREYVEIQIVTSKDFGDNRKYVSFDYPCSEIY